VIFAGSAMLDVFGNRFRCGRGALPAATTDGTLRSRRLSGALLTDPARAAAQAVGIVCDGTVTAFEGQAVPVRARTICVHGDTPDAPRIAAAVKAALLARGVRLAPLGPRNP
jgi:UPF0271 protein